MPSTSKAVASSGGELMTRSRSSARIRCTYSTTSAASSAGSTVKTWSYLFLKYRASLARRPARASATGDDSSPVVETFTKSTTYDTYPPCSVADDLQCVRLHVEAEVDDVAVLHHVVLALDADLAGGLGCGHRARGHQ